VIKARRIYGWTGSSAGSRSGSYRSCCMGVERGTKWCDAFRPPQRCADFSLDPLDPLFLYSIGESIFLI